MISNNQREQTPKNSQCYSCGQRKNRSHLSAGGNQLDGQLNGLDEIEGQPVRCLYFEYGRENRMKCKQLPALELIAELNRRLVIFFGAYLCNVDLQARLDDQDERRRNSRKLKWSFLKRSNWRRQLKFGWISQVITGLFFVLLSHLLAVTYYQYLFDFDLIKLRRYVARNAKGQLGAEANLTANMRMARHQLDQLASSAFLHQTMIIECVYMMLAIFSLLIYLTPLVCHLFLVPFDFGIVRELLDPKQELRRVRRSIKRVVAGFIESGKMFMSSRAIVMNHGIGQVDQGKLEASPNRRMTIVEMRRHEAKLDKLLDDMLDRFALTPLNKRSNSKWPLVRSGVQLLCHLSIVLYSIVFDVLIIWGSFIWPNSDSSEQFRLTQSLVMFSGAGLLIINMPSVSLFAPVYFVATIDQIWFVNQLIKLIENCIELNQRAFDTHLNFISELNDKASQIKSPPPRAHTKQSNLMIAPQQRREQIMERDPVAALTRDTFKVDQNQANAMNSNLIFVLLHYRIFVDQFGPVQAALTAAVSGAVALMLLMPIVVRIHLDYIMQIYVDVASASFVRWSAVAMSSSVLLPANFIIIPLCYLNSRCQKLYKTLVSLMAHVIRVRAHPMGIELYDQHSVTVLQKELSHPDHMTNRFVIRSLLLDGTYGTLIRGHLWWSFLVISILVDHQIGERQDSLILTLMSDPFGLNDRH